jgi:hypothetical protein
MRSQGARAKIAAVDEPYPRSVAQAYDMTPVQDPRRIDYYDERTIRSHVRRERSSAYWFAATKWGILGLIVGMVLGGGGMYVASIGTAAVNAESMSRAIALSDARRNLGEKDSPNFELPPGR